MKAPKIVDGDVAFESNDVVFIGEDEEIMQSVQTILQTNKGEWFLNTDFGLERSVFFQKPFDETLASDAIREAVAQEERIQRIEDITFERNGRTLKVSLTLIKKDGGTLSIEGVNIGVG